MADADHETWFEWTKRIAETVLEKPKWIDDALVDQTIDLPPAHQFDLREWLGNWPVEMPETCAEEFEYLRRLGHKVGMSVKNRMDHLEMHLDRGDVICNCGKEV